MKKTIFAFIFAIMFGMAIDSCCNCTGTATNDVDSTAVDSVEVVDSFTVDSAAAGTVAVDSIVAE